MDFKNAKELLALCQEKKLPISEVMRQREILLGETTAEIVDQRMDRVLEIMKDAAFSPIKDPVISMGGLIGGEARRLCEFHDLGKSLCGDVLGKGITYAMATHGTYRCLSYCRQCRDRSRNDACSSGGLRLFR